jgi:hypothetical protein
MELNSIITNFINQNSAALRDIYIGHESVSRFEGTGVLLVEFNMEDKNVAVNYIPFDIAITEMDAGSIKKLKDNKTLAECSYLICECGTCDTRPKAVYFFLNVEGRNLLVEAEIPRSNT